MNHLEVKKLHDQGYNLLLKSRIYWAEAERTWVDEIDLKKRPLWRDPIFSSEVQKILAQGDVLNAEGNKLCDIACALLDNVSE